MRCKPSSSFGYYQGEERTIYGMLALLFNNLKSYGQVIVKRGYLLRLLTSFVLFFSLLDTILMEIESDSSFSTLAMKTAYHILTALTNLSYLTSIEMG